MPNLRERTSAAIEADRQAAQSSTLTPKISVEMPSRQVPSKMKSKGKKIVAADQTVQIPINYSTMFFGLVFAIGTIVFCYYSVVHGPVSSLIKGLFLLVSLISWAFFMFVFIPPVPQSQLYHNFADQRSLGQLLPSLHWIDMPHALDVLSNIPFFLVGLDGLYLLLTPKSIVFLTGFEKFGWTIFFISITFVCIGSSYYHWRPSNKTLVWDRLPMSVGFSSLLGLLIDERIHSTLGKFLFPFLVTAGFASCAFWYYRDDLRAYILVQFYPVIYIPILLMISSAVYSHTMFYVVACLLYALAKVCEVADKQVFSLTFNQISGHTLKHLLSSGAIAMILYMLKVRVILK